MAKRPGGPGPVDWEASLRELGKRWSSRRKGAGGGYLYLIPIVIIVIIWGLTGIYQVGPGERGVVRQFGARMAGETGPGLHYRLPWPIQQEDVVNVDTVRTAEIGFTTAGQRGSQEPREVLAEALMLTGDENVINIHAIVQYRVRNAGDYLFNITGPEQMLKSAAEVAIRGVVGRNTIDYVLVEARTAVENKTQEFLQGLMDSYGSGILVLRVTLQEVDAPEEVRDAFQDVVRAREDRERLEREAEGYAADIVPRARGEKEKNIQEAAAYKKQRVLRSQGDAERFLSVLEEYRKAPDVTRQRLYLETMETVLPGAEKIIIDPEGTGNALPFLPLRKMGVTP